LSQTFSLSGHFAARPVRRRQVKSVGAISDNFLWENGPSLFGLTIIMTILGYLIWMV
ncbi:MAG: hypothetical protein JWM11_2194, partial [Planctomycetaceae bacterium]|nr:hypothetical protein [Planctomycetaceae bacterium]